MKALLLLYSFLPRMFCHQSHAYTYHISFSSLEPDGNNFFFNSPIRFSERSMGGVEKKGGQKQVDLTANNENMKLTITRKK